MTEFIMQETEEMKTFGSVWKRYEPIAVLVRCKDCKYAPGNNEGYTCKIRDILGIHMTNPDCFFCADGKLKDSKKMLTEFEEQDGLKHYDDGSAEP